MEFLEGIGDFMEREGVTELEISDGDRLIVLRRGAPGSGGPCREEGEESLVTASLPGILRLRSSSEDAPYADVGERKRSGDVLFCIEAMKRINEFHAGFDLVVEEVLSGDGQAVSQGQAVMRVRKAGI